MRRSGVVCGLALVVGIGTASARQARASSETQDADALAGPKVSEVADASGRSLVERDFNGSLVRLETTAEEAAVECLDLSEAERAAAQNIFLDRARVIDGVVADNIPLLLRLQGIRENGLTPDRAQALRELGAKLGSGFRPGSLRDRVAKVLEPPHRESFLGLVRAYNDAIIDEELKATPGLARPKATVRVALQSLGGELRRSYDRRIAEGTQRLDRALEVIQPTPEQESKIRNLALDFAQQSLGKPTQAQRLDFFRKVSKELTPEQRRRLVWEFYQEQPPR